MNNKLLSKLEKSMEKKVRNKIYNKEEFEKEAYEVFNAKTEDEKKYVRERIIHPLTMIVSQKMLLKSQVKGISLFDRMSKNFEKFLK